MFDDIYKCVFFRGNKSDEMIVVCGEYFNVPVGSVIKTLLETDQHFWDSVSCTAKQIIETSKKGLETALRKEQFNECLRNAYQSLDFAKMILSFSAPKLLRNLAVYLSPSAGYMYESSKIESAFFPDSEMIEYGRELLYNSRSKEEYNEIHSEFLNRLDSTGKYAAVRSYWGVLIDYLTGKASSQYLKNIMIDVDLTHDWAKLIEILSMIMQYGYSLIRMSNEAKKLSKTIKLAFALKIDEDISKEMAIEELIDCGNVPSQLQSKITRKVFPENEDNREGTAYWVSTLSSLVSLEMSIAKEYGLQLKTCKLCGGYYLTRKSNSVYCNYPNKTYNDELCKKMGAQICHKLGDKLQLYYEASYNTYFQWINRSKNSANMRKIEERYESIYINGKVVISYINDEIDSNFEKWKRRSRKALKKVRDGLITEEECKAILTAPGVKERSPTFKSWDGSAVVLDEEFQKRLKKAK